MHFLKELWSARELLGNLVLRETRGQYKRTILGRFWSLLNPLASMLVYTFIFAIVFRIQPEPGDPSGLNIFALWLLCGLLPWTFFSSSLNSGMGSLLANASLITKVYFPRAVLPVSAVGTVGINWLFEIGVLVIALLIAGSNVLIWLPLVLLFMALLALFSTGLSLLLSIANIRFRDMQYLITILLQFWMYLTPIIYPASLVKDLSDRIGGLMNSTFTLFDIYTVNPLYHFISVFRQLLYDNRWPEVENVVICLIWTIASLLIGTWVFNRNEKRIAEEL